MMKKIFTKSFIAVALVAVVGFVSSCKDYNDEIMAEYRGEDAKLEDLIDNLEGLLSDLTTKHNEDIEAARIAREQMQTTLEGLINTVKENQAIKDKGQSDSIKWTVDSIKELENLIKKQSDSIKWAVDSIGKLDARIATLEGRVEAIEDLKAGDRLKALEDIEAGQRLDSVEKVLGALQHAIGDSIAIVKWVSDLQGLQADMATAKGNYESLTKRLESMQNSIDNIKSCAVDCEVLDSLVNDVMSPKVDSIADVTTKLRDDVDELDDLVNSFIVKVWKNFNALEDSLDSKVTNLNAAINKIEEAYQTADEVLADSIDAVRADLTELEKRVKANEEAIDSIFGEIEILKGDIADLKDGMKNRISNILVQGAYSPVVGYFNMPLGIKSNILASYKGEVIEDMSFPFGFIDGEINSLIPLQSSLNYDGVTITELSSGKAGKLYLTINPAEVNLDNVDFELVNSQNELAPVKLDSVVVSSDVLKFGYTRAGVPLYEATATITDETEASLDLNLSDYKDILSDLKEGNVNLTDIAGTLYSSINEIADANAVRASWTDSLGAHTVYSDFAVAAVAVKPLSYNFLADLDVQNIPGMNRVSKIIDNVINRINVDIHIGDFKDVEFNVDHLDLDENKFVISIDTTLKVDGQEVVLYEKGEVSGFFVEIGGVEYPLQVKDDVVVSIEGQEVRFTYENDDFVSEILKIEDLVNSELSEIEHLIDQVNDMLAELRETDQKLHQSVNDAKDNVKAELNKYLDKLNDKLCAAINSVNSMLQPVLLANNGEDFALLSQSKSRPVMATNEITLVPTSYTGEYLAPACKKYVAITAVNGSTDNLAAINAAAGERLNKVLDGDVRAINFKGESGNTYEITYSALDYAGMVVNTKYYVTVK